MLSKEFRLWERDLLGEEVEHEPVEVLGALVHHVVAGAGHDDQPGARDGLVQHLAEREGYQGDVQTIIVTPGGYATGAADPRRGGAAVGLGEVRRVVQ